MDCGPCDATTTWFFEIEGRDLAWDRERGLLYVATMGVEGARGDSVVAIDPVAQEAVFDIPVAGVPTQIEISDDASMLYVGLERSGTIQAIDLRARVAGLQFPEGRDPARTYVVNDFAVVPGQPRTVVAVLTIPDTLSRGLAVFEDGVMQARSAGAARTGEPDRIEVASAAAVYGYFGLGLPDLRTITLDRGAVTDSRTLADLDDVHDLDILYEGGLLFTTSGHVIDPMPPVRVDRFDASGAVVSERATNRAYFVFRREIVAFDRTTFAEIGRIGVAAGASAGPVRRLERWGPHGLAYLQVRSAIGALPTRLVVITTDLVAEPR